MQQGSRTDGFGKLNFQHNRPHFSAVNAREMVCSTLFCVRTLLSQDRGLKRVSEQKRERVKKRKRKDRERKIRKDKKSVT